MAGGGDGSDFDYSNPDQIPFLLGQMTMAIRGLGRSIDADRNIANDRHRENTANIKAMGERVGTMEDAVKPMAESVKKMEPVFEGFQASKWRMTGALGALSIVVAFVAWVITQFASQIGAAIFHR